MPSDEKRRRGFLLGGLVSLVGGWFAGKQLADAQPVAAGGTPLSTRLRQGDPPTHLLDTRVLFEKRDA